MKEINLPLFGIIINWKGLKEENILYTEKELREVDGLLCDACIDFPGDLQEGTFGLPNKTWWGVMLNTEDDVRKFALGGFNEAPESNDDWYWENNLTHGLFGEETSTFRKVLSRLDFV